MPSNFPCSTTPPSNPTFISPSRTEYASWKRQTELEISYGLFDHQKNIGFKRQWEVLLRSKGIVISDNTVVKNDVADEHTEPQQDTENNTIDRHKTAISRSNFSKPVQILLQS